MHIYKQTPSIVCKQIAYSSNTNRIHIVYRSHPYYEALERGYLSQSDDSDDDPVGMETMGRGGGGVSGDTDSEESMGDAAACGFGLENAFSDGICGLFSEDACEAELLDFV